MIFDRRCPAWGAVGAAPCATCLATLRGAPRLGVPPGLDDLHAALAYDGPARQIVLALKYRNHRDALPWLAGRMARLVRDRPDVVTFAPTTNARRRERGFDQAEVLARAVARQVRAPCVPLLRRLPGPPQTGRPPAERSTGPRFAARRRAPGALARAARRRRPTVALVDDVVTTGATLGRAARTLRAAGAGRVVGLTAARTLLKPAPRPAEITTSAGE